ncbi:HNH endonuclease [Roseateles albus]|uniref:HNH endonuclease signature motif containing protein n=1 Tax=Roseateles albus TaxID=2987525 RepID=A0ABT5KDV2_9BURK|nr:HNH endonuclease signature motif containing protein [Roseateles albus]MDC8771724.1 HNH endonuclease signature motif containing protein [Roseateles albus]
MDFWKFECSDEAATQASLVTGELRLSQPRVDLDDTDRLVLDKLAAGDGVLLASFDGRQARIFAIGRVQALATSGTPIRVSWLPTPGMQVTPGHSARQYWTGRSAHEISPEPAERYGLPQLLKQCGALRLTPDERRAFIESMKSEGYTGTRLDEVPLACDLLAQLQSEGFDVFPRGISKDENRLDRKKGTIRVESNGKYIAYLSNGSQEPQRHLIGLAVIVATEQRTEQAVPDDFDEADLSAFALEHGVEPSHLELADRSGNKYIRITDFDTALTLIHRNASVLDPYYRAPEDLGSEATRERDEKLIRAKFAATNPARYKRLIEARRGQGRYRTSLLERFQGQCAVSGLRLGAALRASHVLAWSKCETDEQRLDPDNGLLLSPDLDALFDRHLITFDQDGRIRCSPRLAEHRAHHWPLADLLTRPTATQFAYLERHSKEFDRLAARRISR